MFTEDLSQFFDTTNGFAVDGTIKTSAGTTVRTVKAIFENPLSELSVLDANVEALMPMIRIQTSDMAGVDHTCTITINGIVHRIVKHLDDGTGISTVWIRK